MSCRISSTSSSSDAVGAVFVDYIVIGGSGDSGADFNSFIIDWIPLSATFNIV